MSKTQTIWENRYKANGNSGAGSYGVLCEYKAKFINKFIIDNNCKNVIEFGSGDGNQMSWVMPIDDMLKKIYSGAHTKYHHLGTREILEKAIEEKKYVFDLKRPIL
jgi:hypothetical protein